MSAAAQPPGGGAGAAGAAKPTLAEARAAVAAAANACLDAEFPEGGGALRSGALSAARVSMPRRSRLRRSPQTIGSTTPRHPLSARRRRRWRRARRRCCSASRRAPPAAAAAASCRACNVCNARSHADAHIRAGRRAWVLPTTPRRATRSQARSGTGCSQSKDSWLTDCCVAWRFPGVLDVAFDRVDAALDAAAAAARFGRRGEAAAAAAATPVRAAAPLRYIAGLARPQDAFPTPPDNSPLPFVPPPPFGHASGASSACCGLLSRL